MRMRDPIGLPKKPKEEKKKDWRESGRYPTPIHEQFTII